MNTEEILKLHGLDFSIEKHPLKGQNMNGDQMITPYFGLFNSKTNECINTCKAGYTVSQNSDIVDMVLQGISKFGDKLSVSKAGSINGGRRVFMQLAIEGDSKVGDDIVKRYVTIIDSNDGSTSLSVGIGDFNMWCGNQFFKFYKSGEAKFRHTATIEQKIASIPFLIETALDESLRQVEVYRKFLSTPLTQGLADKMIQSVLEHDRLDNPELGKRSVDMIDMFRSNIKTECEHVGDNVWGLFNGLTRYTTHHQSTPKRLNGKDESLISGTAYKKGIVGYEYCLDLI
jgi:hypothetical protein